MKIKFDRSRNVIMPTFVLTARNGRQLGAIPAYNIVLKNRLNSYKELSFTVYKYDNGVRNEIWYKLDNLKLCYCPDWNMYFQMAVEINENDYTEKNVTCTSLGEAELSQIMIFTTQINTEDDILREDYKPTVLWNANYPEASLLSRIMEKAPHYKIKHVDESIKRIQRTFEFDNISIYDAFQEIATEMQCIFIIETKRTKERAIERTISVYDLENVCEDCGNRGEFIDVCPKCDGHNITKGYGEDTTVFCSVDNLAEDIRYSVNLDNVKNCLKLEAGDDLMTATVINCNPNGSSYIYYFNPQTKEDMSKELSEALDEYTQKTQYYQSQYKFNINENIINQYNALVDKYVFYNDEHKLINSEIVGFASLMDAFYATINFDLYLTDGMMPSIDLPETTAIDEVKKLNSLNLEKVAVMDKETASETTVTNAALSYARVLVDSRYKVEVKEGYYSDGRWTGSFTITRYSDETDTAESNNITVVLSDDYGTFVKQKIDKMLAKSEDDTAGIVALFKLGDDKFKSELKKYCLASLTMFYECCQGCLNILIDQGVGDPTLWEDKTPNLYTNMYTPYRNKLSLIQDEIKIREDEIAIIEGKYDKDGNLEKEGIQTALINERRKAQSALDFKSILGDELWEEFCSYRRESVYKNDNYISDGLNDTELFKRALEFLENAQKEVYKSSVLQHSISSTLKNLLVMKEFAPLVDCFDVGNWIRIKIDDKVYKLRLIEYEIDFDDLDHISVDFSDVIDTADGISDLDSILKQAVSISSSYGTVAHQAEAGEQTANKVKDWVDKGLNVTNQRIVSDADNQNQVWDEHGMLFRQYDEVSDDYNDEQLKIINSTLAVTDDNWKTVKTAVGKYYYFDPEDEWKLKVAYGVIGETIVGKVILGEHLGIYADNGSMSFDNNGLNITNGINSFNVNPNSNTLITLSNAEKDLLRVDEKGQLYLCGDGSALDINANDAITGISSRLTQTAEEIRAEVKDSEKGLKSTISQTVNDIKMNVAGYQDEYDTLDFNPTYFGNGSPDETGCPPEGKEGIYYLDRITGGIWKSDGESWSFKHKCELAPVDIQSYFDITKNKITTYVGEAEKGIYSKIEQTEREIRTEIANTEAGLSSSIEQNAESISAEVNRATEEEGKLNSKLSIAADKITTLVSAVDDNTISISEITQTVDNIKSSVVTIDETGNFVGTAIEQNYEYVRIAWNQYSDAVQFQNGGLYILDNTGNILAILDRNGIVAEKGIFRGKIQSGNLNEYGVEIDQGYFKGYTNGDVTAYLSTHTNMTVNDGETVPGLRISGKGGIAVRAPHLLVSKTYLSPGESGSDMYVGADGTMQAVTGFQTVGEGDNRKLQFTYKNLQFVNGIMVSADGGIGSGITDLPVINAPAGDNTIQEDVETEYADVLIDTNKQAEAIKNTKYVAQKSAIPNPDTEVGGYVNHSIYENIDWQADIIVNCNDCRKSNIGDSHFSAGWLDMDENFPLIRGFPGVYSYNGGTGGITYQKGWDMGNQITTQYVLSRPVFVVCVSQYNGTWYISNPISPAQIVNYSYNANDSVIFSSYGNAYITAVNARATVYYTDVTRGVEDYQGINLPGWRNPYPQPLHDLKKTYPLLTSDECMSYSWKKNGSSDIRMIGNDNYGCLLNGCPIGVQFYWDSDKLKAVVGICYKENGRAYWNDNFIQQSGQGYAMEGAKAGIAVTALPVGLTQSKIYAFENTTQAQGFIGEIKARCDRAAKGG